ncbi:hypothetical protein [Actinophytocola gossypii]|uniref:DUF1059 domain-containing protein n=1 Tax=Actinophytocola gossypii TaxID=2812003 RepID=A0ABT2J2E9_9PSEU|nr:hypothetical protein [Actinophytocola gossypii]MCT2581941.1 hypothetical protein [Actinophytocola gossypii]
MSTTCQHGDRDCSIEEATELTVDPHNEIARDFQRAHQNPHPVASPELQRHATSPRYRTVNESAG